MKKQRRPSKLPVLLLAIVCMVFMTACGNDAETINEMGTTPETLPDELSADNVKEDKSEEENTQEAEKEQELLEKAEGKDAELEKIPVARKLSDNLYDFQISIDGMVYQFPMWYSDFEALGWKYEGDNTDTLSNNQYVGVMRWKKDDACVHTEFANVSMDTVAFSDSMVSGISMNRDDIQGCDWEILLPNGIKWGVSNVDDIKAAYGDPTFSYDGDSYYKMIYQCDYYREVCLYVYKDTGVLGQVEIENIVAMEDAADSTDDSDSVSDNNLE